MTNPALALPTSKDPITFPITDTLDSKEVTYNDNPESERVDESTLPLGQSELASTPVIKLRALVRTNL